jgi:hypothetical protein
VAQNFEFMRERRPVLEEYKHYLTSLQRVWLWAASRHRKARVRGAKAVAYLKMGKFYDAMRHLLLAFAICPPVLFDVHGIYLAFKELTNRKQDNPVLPEMWPEWDE